MKAEREKLVIWSLLFLTWLILIGGLFLPP